MNDKLIVKEIKRALNYENELTHFKFKSDFETTYKLSDSRRIVVKDDHIQYPEIILKLSPIDELFDGPHTAVANTINKVDPIYQKALFDRFLLSDGLLDCLQREVPKLPGYRRVSRFLQTLIVNLMLERDQR